MHLNSAQAGAVATYAAGRMICGLLFDGFTNQRSDNEDPLTGEFPFLVHLLIFHLYLFILI